MILILKAPFSGKIANLQYKIYEKISPGDDFCTLIDDSVFEVEFSVLETELQEISLNKEVKIIPFAIDTLVKGRVSEINPVVEENGLIKVKAVVRNPGMLMEGMNVKVLVENEAPGQLVVPKSAIVLRQNQEVLFLVELLQAGYNLSFHNPVAVVYGKILKLFAYSEFKDTFPQGFQFSVTDHFLFKSCPFQYNNIHRVAFFGITPFFRIFIVFILFR